MLLIDNKNITDPTLNLALEEYCVRNLDMSSDYILFYINDPSVIIGKHQNTIEEINSEYVKENSVHIVRRISGGGAVYHDNGNLNFSFMTKHSQKSIHNFKLFTEPVINVLKQLGVNAELNGRNDITVDNRKISGNAQFTDTKSMFSHGTLLFDSNLENVVKALNVNSEKIESKGIKSVRSRVANIKEFLSDDISIHGFREKIINSIFEEGIEESIYCLSDEQWKEVYVLAEMKYRSWEWNYGRSPEFNVQRVNRFPIGQIDARIFVKDGLIENIKFFGDFLGHGEISDLENLFKGEKFQKENLLKVLRNTNLDIYLDDIGHDDFVNFLIT
jgi:lipoate-protein ligase A